MCRKVSFTSPSSTFLADIENVGHRDGDVEQAQAEVHGDDQQHQQLLQRLHPSDAAERDQLELMTMTTAATPFHFPQLTLHSFVKSRKKGQMNFRPLFLKIKKKYSLAVSCFLKYVLYPSPHQNCFKKINLRIKQKIGISCL